MRVDIKRLANGQRFRFPGQPEVYIKRTDGMAERLDPGPSPLFVFDARHYGHEDADPVMVDWIRPGTESKD